MKRATRRRLTDIALLAGLVAAWVTHESGALLHSVVSLGFTAALFAHAKNNWTAYRSQFRRRRTVGNIDVAISTAMVVVVITGLVFWATGGDTTLGHEPIAIVATVALLAHFWNHRQAATRLLSRKTVTVSDRDSR